MEAAGAANKPDAEPPPGPRLRSNLGDDPVQTERTWRASTGRQVHLDLWLYLMIVSGYVVGMLWMKISPRTRGISWPVES
jgi:hypothetical protein